jgi:prepilin-type N-terminal cleavage/methylation domain-containing protein
MSDHRRGFTLIEVVLGMSMLALIASICYGAFHLGIRAVERGEVAVVTAQRLRVASDVLIRQVKSIVAYPACNAEEEVYPYFVGTATSMTFITATGLEGGGGLTRVAYQLVDDPPRLVMAEGSRFSPAVLGEENLPPPTDRAAVLLDGFKTLRFQYMMNDGVDTEWRDEWDSYEEEMLPAAVRILIEGLPGIELETWGQEIPLMLVSGDNVGEVDDGDVGNCARENEDDLEGGSPPPTGGAGGL